MADEKVPTNPMEKMRLRMAAEGYNTLPLDFEQGRIIVTIIAFKISIFKLVQLSVRYRHIYLVYITFKTIKCTKLHGLSDTHIYNVQHTHILSG